MTELNELSPVEQQAMHTGAAAMGALIEFSVRIMGTTRAEVYNETVEAVDVNDAARIARERCPPYHDEEEVYDEIAYIQQVDGMEFVDDEQDFDIRVGEVGKREPLSWVATALVDRIANLDVDQMPDPARVLRQLIQECKEMK